MFGLKHLSIKSKLQIILLFASLGSILVISYLSWSKAREILTHRIFDQLTSVRASKAYQVEAYFKNLENHLQTLCENQMTVAAMREFNQSFDDLDKISFSLERDAKVESYYTQEFFPRLAKNIEGEPLFETYRPTGNAARELQYQYIANNPNPVGKKDVLDDAKDNSKYSAVHRRYHPLFRNLIKRFGYSDLFLIDAETGDIVYTVYKETDFGTNLYSGPYRNTNLAEVVRQARDNPDLGAIQLVDFQFYRPSYNAPAAFIAGSIYDGSRRVGILAVQLPVDEINRVLTGNQNWKQDGLGDTGETYLVGDDLRLRSAARLLLENPAAYLDVLRHNQVRSEIVSSIEKLKTALLVLPINTEAAKKSMAGKSGTQIMQGYGGSDVLSSYAPLNIHGVNWGIISEMALSEAYAPINALQNYLLLSTIVLILLLTLLATIASQRLMRPIDLMIQRYGSRHVEGKPLTSSVDSPDADADNSTPEMDIGDDDELRELSQIFQEMRQQIHEKIAALAQKEQENEMLLLNILPRPLMERWRQGDTKLVDRVQQVTVIAIQIVGLAKSTEQQGVQTVANAFNEFIVQLDDTGEKSDIERLDCFGDRYIAACGLTKPRLDHVKRVVDFAHEALNLVKAVNQKYNLGLNLRIGIHTGAVTAALIGQKKFRYDLWGEPLSIASQLERQAEPNTIRVTQAVYDPVRDLFPFESNKSVVLEDKRTLPTWVLGKTGLRDLIDELTFGLSFDDDDDLNPHSTEERD
ncbi:MAG TPA: adenylate/guanylate cyclase domain-containing protein [Cyanobacteria bacterium UBA8803]|nr:adenylate/guanylate cyclase domain-containing protein [Cyanobacteria bacterium UBA9273]HBL60471.1 adenylate/guanylate cyclase domain-containing protein [Cyanobacteria bacterium UBA8803]